jgi:hypothetical protein
MLGVLLLNVFLLSVIQLSVVAPHDRLENAKCKNAERFRKGENLKGF